MADKLDRTRVDQLGRTDNIQDSDDFIVSQRVENDENGNAQNATNIVNFNTMCGHIAESSPVVNKMLEIHHLIPQDGYPGSVKPGFGIDMQQDGTLDNALYMNKNLVFCGDDLTAGWLYSEEEAKYYKPNNLELPMGMAYVRNAIKDGVEPPDVVVNNPYVKDYKTYLGGSNEGNTWVKKSAKLGKFVGEESNDDYGPADDRVYDSNYPNNPYAPFQAAKLQHVIEWTNIGLAANTWYSTASNFPNKNPFEHIILCRVANRADVSSLDPARRSITVTFKTRVKDTVISSENDFTLFKATLGPNDMNATLVSSTGLKLGRIILWDLDNDLWSQDFDRVEHKRTGVPKNRNQGNDLLLAWQIGLKRPNGVSPSTETDSTEDTFTDIASFLNGTLTVVGIKAEYGEESTGFDKPYYHDFSSKDTVLNQSVDAATYNTLVRETQKSNDQMDNAQATGKFPDILFSKIRPASLVEPRKYGWYTWRNAFAPIGPKTLLKGPETSERVSAKPNRNSAEHHEVCLNYNQTGVGEDDYHSVAKRIYDMTHPDSMDGDDNYKEDIIYKDAYGEDYTPMRISKIDPDTHVETKGGIYVYYDQSLGDSDNHDGYETVKNATGLANVETNGALDSRHDESFPCKNSIEGGPYNNENILENLKIANQTVAGTITVNSSEFSLKDRIVACGTGGWYLTEDGSRSEDIMWPSDGIDPETGEQVPQRARIFKRFYKLSCREGNKPVYSSVRDMLCLKPATFDEIDLSTDPTSSMQYWNSGHLGGVMISKNGGLNIDENGVVSLKAGAGLSVDNITGVVSVTGTTGVAKDVSVAPEFDEAATYSVGDYVMHDGLLYQCNTAISTPEYWYASHWTQTDVVSNLGGTGGATIDDTTTSTTKTWSSNKINTELGTKQDTLTAGTGISITNNVISATGGGGGASNLTDLGDVSVSSPSDSQILRYNSTSGKWENSNEQIHVPSLGGLLDVVLSSPVQGGDILRYSSISNKWYNQGGFIPTYEATGTLTAGNTTVTISDAHITTGSTIDAYTNPELPHNSISVSTGSVTITFDAQSADVAVKVRIS